MHVSVLFWLCLILVAAGRFSLVAAIRGYSVAVSGLLIVVASLVAEHELWAPRLQ